jgi:hypothetical protein
MLVYIYIKYQYIYNVVWPSIYIYIYIYIKYIYQEARQDIYHIYMVWHNWYILASRDADKSKNYQESLSISIYETVKHFISTESIYIF